MLLPNFFNNLLCSLFAISCLSLPTATPRLIAEKPILPPPAVIIQSIENNENNSSVFEEGIVSKTDQEGIVDFEETDNPVAIIVPTATETINYIQSLAAAPAIYAPKDFAPLDPVGDQYAKWLETAWINNVVPAEVNLAVASASLDNGSNDQAATSSIESTMPITPATSTVTSTFHLVINAVRIGTASSTIDEFIEIYNPTSDVINLADWKLKRVTASGKTENYLVRPFPAGAIINSLGYYLIAHPDGYSTTTADRALPDIVYTTASSIASSNTIILFNRLGEIVDLVGWGEASQFEGAPAAELENDGQNLARTDGIDTDHNDVDFKLISR